ncbi:MAG TPA: peptide MFS transporter [Candidatus Eisenbacteria bacterium]|jgi:POT family proton-dependent oligopeptide transporter
MATAVERSAPAAPESGTIFGHPRGLYVLFFTEMWERFSYYGMRSLLVLYMVNHLFLKPDVGQRVLGFTAIKGALESVFGPLAAQPLSSQIYGLYTAFVYLTPFFGGLLADRVLGQRRAVILGAVLMAIGHFLMASERMFLPALMFLILGNGAFKPNISTQVGSLYPPGDPRRDGAFTIFYMGINLGAFFSPLVCGTLGQKVGWHYGFGAAGVGMVLGLILYVWGQRWLGVQPSQVRTTAAGAATSIAVYIASVVAGLLLLVLGPALLSLLPVIGRFALLGAAVIALITWLTRAMTALPRDEALRVGALIVICALNVVFWAVYEQQGNTMQLWADQNTDWRFFGLTIPSTWFQAFNPAMIFLFAPLLNLFWGWQSARKQEPSSVTKMALGCLMLGLSYVVMIVASQGLTPEAKRSVMWLTGTTVILTFGELYLSPIGLSFVTKVAPQRMVSMLMGVWFLANFFGNYLSGYLGTFWEKISRGQYFTLMTILGIGAGLLMFLISRPLDRIVAKHDRGEA